MLNETVKDVYLVELGATEFGVSVEEYVQKVQLKSWQWLKHRGSSFNYSFTDWMLNPLICIRS